MKISVNDQELYSLNDTQISIFGWEQNRDNVEDDLKRRLQWILHHKMDEIVKAMKQEWIPKLEANGVKMIPINNEEFARIVFSQPNYKDRKVRDLELLKQD